MVEDPSSSAGDGTDAVDATSVNERAHDFAIVGAGASAGGLEALTQLLHALPADTGLGFVVVQHLAPSRDSILSEILARATSMPVLEVRDEPTVEPNHVYVIPAGRDMIIADGKLRLLPQERGPLHRGIDQFFRSLAVDRGHLAIGVVLSGGARDGTLGLEEIKAAGGITFAQNESAQQGSMPRSAIASGCVDFVLPPDEIAKELVRIARHVHVTPATVDAETDVAGHLGVVRIIQRATGVDFAHYKANTLNRRITRRMLLHKLTQRSDYESLLQRDSDEVESLYRDFLISVTSFFRDPAAFEALSAQVFPEISDGLSDDEPARIWCVGCSTGEEAYSLAIAFTEYAERIGGSARPLIFATDLNAVAIGVARAGLYPKSIAADVSPERLLRHFTEEEGGYRIAKSIRERCVFSRHDILSDPPFSRVDLVVCRNLLIYLDASLHERVLSVAHYANKPRGYLFLGGSESLGASRARYDVVDARHRIFRRRAEIRSAFARARHTSLGVRFTPPRRSVAEAPAPPATDVHRMVERALLSRYAPPGVLVTAELEILEFRGNTEPFLAPAEGAASLHLMRMLREGLMGGVRSALLRAMAERGATRETGLRLTGDSAAREITVEVIPVDPSGTSAAAYLVLFEVRSTPSEASVRSRETDSGATTEGDSDSDSARIARLTHELEGTREHLQAIIERQEADNLELQSAIEEAQSANEELQSVNEELETSKEEIQSTNEELATVNDELNTRNAELNRVNDSLERARNYAESIVDGVRWPLVVLDAELRVKTASRAYYEFFRVGPDATVGRRFFELGAGEWEIPALRALIEQRLVADQHVDDFEVEHTFAAIGHRVLLVNARRLTPMVPTEPAVVLAIEDITDRRKRQDELLHRASDLATADRSKDEFLAMLAHELRNPLAPMRTAVEVLRSLGADDDARGTAQDVLARQIEDMSRMIDDLLDVSRITEGKIELRRQIVSLESVLSTAATLARTTMDARSQELLVEAPAVPVHLDADATRLHQVFGNLLVNASKYSGNGARIFVSVERGSEEARDWVVVRIRDEGIGIDPELLPRVFDLFVQASRAHDRTQHGLGIGLTLVKRLVLLHGGSVSAHSDGVGHGSEFVVRLPMLPELAADAVRRASPLGTPESPKRVLVVDDNEDAARGLATLLALRGHATRAVFSGIEAISAAVALAPEVVILDIGLPGIDGYEVARRMRRMDELRGVLVVAVSGYGTEDDRVRAREAGFDAYLLKPVDLNALYALIRALD